MLKKDDQQADAVSALTSPRLPIHFDIAPPTWQELRQLDGWLLDALRLDASVWADTGGETEDASQRTLLLLRRVLAVARLLLEAGGVPVFDQPEVGGLPSVPPGGAAGTFRAQVLFQYIDYPGQNVYTLAVKGAISFCWLAARSPLTGESRSTMFEKIDRSVVRPLKGMVPGGKSTISVLRVAHALGIPYLHLGDGVFQLGWGCKARRMDRSGTDRDTAIGARMSHDKVVAANLLRMVGLPAPLHEVVTHEADAVDAARKLGYPVVVKPSDCDRGEGVVVDIAGDAALGAAFTSARELARNKKVIVERQVAGVCHRLFIAHGRLLYAVKRLPMSIAGDGHHTVAELVEAELARQRTLQPWLRSEIQPLDDMARMAIHRIGLTPESVPEPGVLVPLRRIESTEWGGVDEEVSHCIHPENLAVALRAAQLFGLHVAGIDIITPDISVPWYENGAIINEVNFCPLLGGGEISRRHIPEFLRKLMQGDGRIPVEVFEGEGAAKAAVARHTELTREGRRCFLAGNRTLDAAGRELRLPLPTVEARVKALLLRPDVDALVVLKEPRRES